MKSPMRIEDQFTLLLTASVNVMGMGGVAQPDPRLRERDYALCLAYYVRQHPRVRRIVFVENSGWPLDRIRAAAEGRNPHGKELEFISLNCNDFPRHLGKGYGEYLLLDRAMEASRLARRARWVGKITGRNYLLNLTQLLGAVRGDFGLLVDLRDHGIYEWLGLNWDARHAESRFLVFSPAFYERFIRGRYRVLDDSRPYMIENLLYDLATRPPSAAEALRRFPLEPEFAGRSGDGRKDYGSGREVFKRRVRGAARRFVPWLHI